jgi:hypothetical protein
MSRHRMKLLSLPAFLALLLFSSCDLGRAPVSDVSDVPTAPTTAAYSQSLSSYTRIEGRIPTDIPDLQVSKLIGIEGGSVNLAGHTIKVPAGAVEQPTLFTLTLATNGYVEVDLSATVTDLLGNTIDTGSKGFKKPVTLSLTYAWASNVSDPSRLLILRMLGNGKVEALNSTVQPTGKTVTVQLDHFSKYCVASN